MKKCKLNLYNDIINETIHFTAQDSTVRNIYLYKTSVDNNQKKPAIVFYFGGGFIKDNPEHFKMQAEYFAHLGFICMIPHYRTMTEEYDLSICFSDARDSFIEIVNMAEKLNIDTQRIILCGGSAGGTLAASIPMFKHFDKENESSIPAAMVLFNPVLQLTSMYNEEDESLVNINGDLMKIGDLNKKIQKNKKIDLNIFSPANYILEPLPKCLIMSGTQDEIVNIKELRKFSQLYNKISECALIEYNDCKHGFFNWNDLNIEQDYFHDTLHEMEEFLRKNKFIDNKITKIVYEN